MLKKLLFRRKNDQGHWVGDGFPVRTLFSYNDSAKELSPFLLLDYAGPVDFPPSNERRGVGEHPHRGFETVTIVYDGEVEHRDSAGGGGIIRRGDVQWMTAASGVVHEEMHGKAFSEKGGRFEMVQLWVNLPKKDKLTTPRYQAIEAQQIPVVTLPAGAGEVRVIAGAYGSTRGPAKTFTSIDLWDLHLNAGSEVELVLPKGHTVALCVLSGELLSGVEKIASVELAGFDTTDAPLEVKAVTTVRALLMSGAPIDEPVVGQGPFVMNSQGEIKQAMEDFRQGKMGRLTPAK